MKFLSSPAGSLQGQAECKRTCLGSVAFASVRAWLGVTVLSSGKHVLVAEISSLLQGILPRKIDSKAEEIMWRSCAVLTVSG